MKRLPIYKAIISDEDTGVYTISLVEDPAVEMDFLYFSKDDIKLEIQNEEKRIVRGLVMECNKAIYRRNGDFEYYITFDADTIRKMAQKYLKDGLQECVDTQHSGNLIEGVEMVQWFISDKENGINPKGFETVADHSLFAEFKVSNDQVWEQIKNGELKGFSLSGLFELVEKENTELSAIEELFNKINKHNSMKLSNIKEALQKILVSLERVTTDKGIISYDADAPEVGLAVVGIDEEGNEYPLEDGDYTLENKTIYRIADGKIAEIIIPEEKPADEVVEEVTEDMACGDKKKKVKGEEEVIVEEPVVEDEKDLRIKELEAQIAEKVAEIEENKAEIETLKARIKELEEKPAEAPATEEFEKQTTIENTGDRKLDNLRRIVNSK